MQQQEIQKALDFINSISDIIPIYTILAGSYAYRLQDEESDIDVRSIFIPTGKRLFFPSENVISSPDSDTVCYSIAKAVCGFISKDIIRTEMLYVPEDCILQQNELGMLLRKNREMFLSQNLLTGGIGCATQAISRARTLMRKAKDKENTSQKEKRAIWKSAAFAIKAFDQTAILAKTGVVRVVPEMLDTIREIKAGNPKWFDGITPTPDFLELGKETEEKARLAEKYCIQHNILPKEPNLDKTNKFIIDLCECAVAESINRRHKTQDIDARCQEDIEIEIG